MVWTDQEILVIEVLLQIKAWDTFMGGGRDKIASSVVDLSACYPPNQWYN